MGSPPYFPVGSGIEGDHPQKVACRFELRGDIADYCAVAVRHLAPGGVFACVFPQPDGQRERLLEAAARHRPGHRAPSPRRARARGLRRCWGCMP